MCSEMDGLCKYFGKDNGEINAIKSVYKKIPNESGFSI